MRLFEPGAVDIGPIPQPQWPRRPPPRPAEAIAIANKKIGDPAAPPATAGRTAPCSPSELTTRPPPRLARP